MPYFDPTHEGEPFPRVGMRLATDVQAATARLADLDESRASQPVAEGKWSPKEILGHLIDSAANNHQRFVSGQQGPSLRMPATSSSGGSPPSVTRIGAGATWSSSGPPTTATSRT